MSTNFGIWKDDLCMLTHAAEERRLRPKCLWRDTISSVLINSSSLKREKHWQIAFANLHDIMTPTITNFKLSISCSCMRNWEEMCKTASMIWLQHATGYTKVDWFTSPVPKGGAYGNTVPWKIKMRLGAESRIGSPVYGAVRSPVLPTQPSPMPVPQHLTGNQFSLWRKRTREILGVGAQEEQRAVVRLWTENREGLDKKGKDWIGVVQSPELDWLGSNPCSATSGDISRKLLYFFGSQFSNLEKGYNSNISTL